MTTSKKEGSVEYQVLPGGDHAIGVVREGVFVPFAQLDANYVAGRVESGKSPEAQAAAEDEKGATE